MRVLKLRLLAVALLASALGGCMLPTNTLSKADIATFKLADIRVSVAPGAKIIWYEPLQAYAAAKKIPDEQYVDAIKTEEAKAHVNSLLASKVKGAMEKEMGAALNGARPVRLEIAVTQFLVPTAPQRLLVGGVYAINADITLVDAKSGAVLIAHPNLGASLHAEGGVVGVVAQAVVDSVGRPASDSLIDQLATIYRIWLINNAKKA
jgi:hypothetical protein